MVLSAKKRLMYKVFSFILFFIFVTNICAQVTLKNQISISGTASDSLGNPIVGEKDYRIRFWDAETDGSQIGSDVIGSVTLSAEGVFNIPIYPPAGVTTQDNVWYELALDTNDDGIDADDVFSERVAVYGVPYAQNADLLDGENGSYYLDAANLTGTIPTDNLNLTDDDIPNDLNLGAVIMTDATVTNRLRVDTGVFGTSTVLIRDNVVISSGGGLAVGKSSPTVAVDAVGSIAATENITGATLTSSGGAVVIAELGSLPADTTGKLYNWGTGLFWDGTQLDAVSSVDKDQINNTGTLGFDWADGEVADDITASNYLPLTGGTITGDVTATAFFGDGSNLTGIDSTVDKDQINNSGTLSFDWADDEIADSITASNYLPLAGGTITGDVTATAFYGDGSNLTGIDSTVDKDEINNSGTLGFDWADDEVADDITASNYLSLSGGTLTGALTATTVNTGQGANELYAMNQDVQTTDAVAFSTINTGQGANELYAMNQDVETTDDVTFNNLTLSGNVVQIGSGAAPGTTTNKLYNSSGNLYWNGTQLDAGGGEGTSTNLVKAFTIASGGSVSEGDVVQLLNSGEIAIGNGAPFGSQQSSTESTTDTYVRFTSVSSDTFVFIWTRPDFGAVAGKITDGVVSWGSKYTIDSNDPAYSLDIAKIAENRAVIFYNSAGDSEFEVIDISGTTITQMDNEVALSFYNYFGRVHRLGDNKWIAITRDTGNAAVMVGTYDPVFETITLGSETSLGASENNSAGWHVVGFSASEAAALYSTSGTNFIARSLSISGTTVTSNSTAQLNTEDGNYVEVFASETEAGKFYFTFYSGSSYLGTATRSGTSITSVGKTLYGTFLLNPIEMGAGSVAVGYQDWGEVAGMVFATVSGSTVTFGTNRNTAITDAFWGIGKLSSTQFAMGFEAANFSAVIGTYAGGIGTFLGVADEAGVATESVDVVLDGISNNHSGLTPGVVYYGEGDGSLSTTSSPYKAGLAVSSTELLLDIER